MSQTIPEILVHLKGGSYFTILPTKSNSNVSLKERVPVWYTGDIYSMETALPQMISLPSSPSLILETKYDIFVSGDYEVANPSSLQA